MILNGQSQPTVSYLIRDIHGAGAAAAAVRCLAQTVDSTLGTFGCIAILGTIVLAEAAIRADLAVARSRALARATVLQSSRVFIVPSFHGPMSGDETVRKNYGFPIGYHNLYVINYASSSLGFESKTTRHDIARGMHTRLLR